MSTMPTDLNDFPELTVEVSPIVERSRATFAKTHNRPAIVEFTKLFSESSK
ncbi:hypothetical protein [Microbacterium sp. SORGH_AS_0421]|uniref:hypothetical protein n=1 Tax=Microbacterium sp. SORGH_AS_0421 TaxID=3041768 RepID=UPI0027D840AA|nr:hypothetical protein [Microbacterium sp. SORGH_AS_0421]